MSYTGFDKLRKQFAKQGAKNPGGLAASIGRAKYGKRKFNQAAKQGKKLRGAKPKKKR